MDTHLQLPHSDVLAEAAGLVTRGPTTCRNLTAPERRGVYCEFLASSLDGVITVGAFDKVASQFGCHARTVRRIWAIGQASLLAGAVVADVDSKRKGKSCIFQYFIKQYRFLRVQFLKGELFREMRCEA